MGLQYRKKKNSVSILAASFGAGCEPGTSTVESSASSFEAHFSHLGKSCLSLSYF